MVPAFLLGLIFAAAEALNNAGLDDLIAAVEFCRSPPMLPTGLVSYARLLVKLFSIDRKRFPCKRQVIC